MKIRGEYLEFKGMLRKARENVLFLDCYETGNKGHPPAKKYYFHYSNLFFSIITLLFWRN